MDTATLVSELLAGCRATPGVTTLAVFGSTAESGAARRDEWSDIDFAVFARPEDAQRVSAEWAFLPRPHELVLTAREYDSGGVAMYGDATMLEFGAGLPWEVTDPTCEVLLGGADLTRGAPPVQPDAANSVRLFLAKLLIGVGRVHRGEVLAGGVHIRCHAAGALAAALRSRVPAAGAAEPNAFDPLRRFEAAYPGLGERLVAAMDGPAEAAGLAMFELAREVLEPGWPEFPSRAADVVASRLGWTAPQAELKRHCEEARPRGA